MPYITNYRLQFKSAPQGSLGINSTIIIDIADTQSGETEEWGYVELKGAVDAFTVEGVNNGEDKWAPIRAKKATIQFNSTTSLDLNTFTGDDDRYLVHAWIEETSETIFKGFLVLDDNREAYLPKPNVVTLTATDNVGLLKDVALTKADGTNPKGEYSIIEYIAWALQKTGLELDIYVGNNVKEENTPTQIYYRSIYLNAKTWEDEVGTSIDCYTVLERILGEHCFLTQQRGAWYIMRIDEYEWTDQNFRLHRFDYEGTYIEELANQNLDMEIGVGKDMKFSQEATEVRLVRPMKFIKETYSYQYPREIVDNIDFERGDKWEDSLQDIPNFWAEGEGGEMEERYGRKYDFDEWTPITRQGGTVTTPYIRRDFDLDDYEKARYVVFPKNSTLGQYAIMSNAVPVGKSDKFTFGIDWKLSENFNGQPSSYAVAMVRLNGEDGSHWLLMGGTNPAWMPGGTSWEMNYYVTHTPGQTVDLRNWQSVSVDSPPCPVGGDIYVLLIQDYRETEADHHYQNLTFDYKPHINGSYLKYKAQHTKVEQEAGLRSNRDEQVYLSDSPRKLFKGAMMWRRRRAFGAPGYKYTLARSFWNGGVPSLYDEPTPESLHPFGHLQAYEVWNQHNRVMRVFEATIQGLQLNVGVPGMINRYKFTDGSIHNAGKFFVLLHSSQDFYTG